MTNTERKQAREEKLENFNPNENGLRDNGIFGLPFGEEESEIILLPVPWEVTVSYATGTAGGPEAILNASQQIDLYDPIYPGGWRSGIAMKNISTEWKDNNLRWRESTNKYLEEFTSGNEISPESMELLEKINEQSENLSNWVKEETTKLLDEGKIVGVVGGEHSVPLGFLEALSERYNDFGILQIDAHADLRPAYEGFICSHASIFYNAMHIPQMTKLVQVGIRDYSEEEREIVDKSEGRIRMYADYEIKNRLFEGDSWKIICEEIVNHLPQNVYVSFDIDGLQPWLCPNTGTPVPGGFQVEEAAYLLEKLVESGRKIIGFDLCEVAPGGGEDEWDGNVGSRVLYKMCLLAAKSNGVAR